MDTWEINPNIFMIAFAIVVFIGATVEVTMKKQRNINLILTFIYLLKLVLVTLYLLSTIDMWKNRDTK